MRLLTSGFSLRLKATGITLAITTLALTIMAATGIVQIRERIDTEQHRSADAVALGIARASELAMTVRDKRELTRQAYNFLRDENVLFVAVYGAAGQHVIEVVRDRAAWDDFQRGRADSARCIVGISPIERGIQSDEFDGNGPKEFVTPALMGRVFVGISTRRSIEAQIHHSRLMSVAAVAAGLVASGILFVVFGPWMRRLSRLADASESLSRGNLGTIVGDRRDDEIGKVARSFDEMSVALCERDQKLRRFTDTLQAQVRQRTADLEMALAAAEEASRAKSLFLANMSHELRTPLNGVIGMVDLLLAAEPTSQQRRYCDIAKSSGRALLDLINDILDFSKIEAGKLELDAAEFDLHAMIHGVVQMLGERAEKKKLELVCGIRPGTPITVKGDLVRLRQVVVNLTSNAIKFTERGEVVVDASLESQTPSHVTVRISVRDTGIGIPADRAGRLFQSFSQVDASMTRKFGGTGLGLAISKRLVELMGGSIGVESVEGQGATFWFTATLEKCAQAAPRRESALGLRGLRVLAVDDNQTNREILNAQLASWSMRADTAAGAAAAMTILREAAAANDPYRVAILDMHMPGTDGMELAGWIKSDAAIKDLILISLSSIGAEGKQGSRHFAASLTKPAMPSQLFDSIVGAMAMNGAGAVIGDHGAAQSGSAMTPRLDGVTILLAEDNEVNRMVASELLEQSGCRVSMVVNGREAVEAALAGTHDAILMDCQMPEMDGFEATGRIRQAEAANTDAVVRRRLIIALTANAIKGDRERCIAAGMDGYVTKPIDPIELMGVIRSLLPTARLAELRVAAAAREITTPPTSPASGPLRIESSAASPIDLDALQKRCMGNRKLAAKALNKFESTMTADIGALCASVKVGDSKSAAAAAHKIKGAAANVSAVEVQRVAGELERLARSDDLSATQAICDQLDREMARFREYLGTAIEGLGQAGAAVVPMETRGK